MLQLVDVGIRSIAADRGIAPDAILDELAEIDRDLRGARVLHVNATPDGGGVSQLLRSVVPLLNDLGFVADWRIIGADDAFFDATKALQRPPSRDSSTSPQRPRTSPGAGKSVFASTSCCRACCSTSSASCARLFRVGRS